MSYSVKVDGKSCECRLTAQEVCFKSDSTSVHIKTEDIIGCEVVPPYFFFRQYALYLWYIKEEGKKLTKVSLHISGDENVCEKLKSEVEEKRQYLPKRPKSLLVLINPIGGKKTAMKDYTNIAEPVFQMAGIKCDVIVSERQKHMRDVVMEYDFKEIDGIVVLGGDGSYSEVVSVLLRRKQKEAGRDCNDPATKIRKLSIPIGMLLTGSGNCIVGDTTGFKDVLNSTLHILKGNVFYRNAIGSYADNKLLNYTGIAASYGAFTDFIWHSDTKYRWLGPLRYYIVPLWFGLFKPFINSFYAEVTFYTDVTETEDSKRQISGEKEVLIEGKLLKGVKSYTKDSVVIEGRFSNVSVFNGNAYDSEKKKITWNKSLTLPGHVFSTILYHESLTELQLLKHLKEILDRAEERTTDFLEIVNARGLRIRVKDDRERDGSETDMLRHITHVDGEMSEIDQLDIQYWLHEKVVPVFTSYS